MEAQTDIQTYLEQGRQALAQGQAREAAIAYAHGAQMEPDNPLARLNLAAVLIKQRDFPGARTLLEKITTPPELRARAEESAVLEVRSRLLGCLKPREVSVNFKFWAPQPSYVPGYR